MGNNKSRSKKQKTANHNEIQKKTEPNIIKKDFDNKESKTETEVVNADVEVKSEMADINKIASINNKPANKYHVIISSIIKVVVPLAACAVIVAVIVFIFDKKNAGNVPADTMPIPNEQENATVSTEPVKENEHQDVIELMNDFYNALANGDMETVKRIRDYTDETSLLTFEKKSAYIESYDNIVCYTKNGNEPDTYYVYVSYEIKFVDIDTKAPGLNSCYVYKDSEGQLRIDGDMDEEIAAALKMATTQEDVVDIFNKIDVNYTEAIASDEKLAALLENLPNQIKTEVGVALAKLEDTSEEDAQSEETEVSTASEEVQITKSVNEQVKTLDTVNVRSSDSETADKVGKATKGTVLTRLEEKLNGWSKIVYNGKEAYIKSDYLQSIAPRDDEEIIGTVTAKSNVNVRSLPDTTADRIGVAQQDNVYNVLENQGEWLKIDYNGRTGYVKAEFFM